MNKLLLKFDTKTIEHKRNRHLLYFAIWYIFFMVCFLALNNINSIQIIDDFHKTLIDIGFNVIKFISFGLFGMSIINGLLGLYCAIQIYSTSKKCYKATSDISDVGEIYLSEEREDVNGTEEHNSINKCTHRIRQSL